MYTKPTLKRFGAFRELTQGGFTGPTDPFGAFNGNPGCSTPVIVNGTTTSTCLQSTPGSR